MESSKLKAASLSLNLHPSPPPLSSRFPSLHLFFPSSFLLLLPLYLPGYTVPFPCDCTFASSLYPSPMDFTFSPKGFLFTFLKKTTKKTPFSICYLSTNQSIFISSHFIWSLIYSSPFPIFMFFPQPPPKKKSVRCIAPFEVPYSSLFFSVHAPALRAVNALGSK